MGGSESVDFLAPSGSGENTLVTCENGDFAADLEVARAVPRAPEFPPRLDAPEEVETPGIDDDARRSPSSSAIDVAATSKAMPVDEGRRHRRAGARPRRRPARGRQAGRRARRAPSRPSTEDEIRAAFGAEPGSLGPVGFEGEVVADETLRDGQFVAGANRTGWHLRGVEAGRDFEAALRRPPRAERGRPLRRTAAARSASRPRSRSATSSSSARATRCRSRRRSSTRTGRRSRS